MHLKIHTKLLKLLYNLFCTFFFHICDSNIGDLVKSQNIVMLTHYHT